MALYIALAVHADGLSLTMGWLELIVPDICIR